MTGLVTGFLLLVVTQVLWGVGWAFLTGADVEWITDEAGQMVWQPAEGGEAVSASDAGYGGAEAPADESEEKPDENIAPEASGGEAPAAAEAAAVSAEAVDGSDAPVAAEPAPDTAEGADA